jgi:hypothetical protein
VVNLRAATVPSPVDVADRGKDVEFTDIAVD